jgi:NADH:ubiquinone oxidoreductase subunit 6 (subunit J)
MIYFFIKNFNLFYFDNQIIYHNWIYYNNIKIKSIGQLLFNDCYILFLGATLLLFVAMLGAIMLTMEKNNKFNKYSSRLSTLNINWKINK